MHLPVGFFFVLDINNQVDFESFSLLSPTLYSCHSCQDHSQFQRETPHVSNYRLPMARHKLSCVNLNSDTAAHSLLPLMIPGCVLAVRGESH